MDLDCLSVNDTSWPDSACRASEPVRLLILHLANEFCAMGLQPRNESIDVIDGKHDATKTQSVHWRVHGSKPDRIWSVEGGGLLLADELNTPESP